MKLIAKYSLFFFCTMIFFNCNSGIEIKIPINKNVNELCDYYSWAKFYTEGELMFKDTSLTAYYTIPNNADSVEIYANGFGYAIIDTAFSLTSNCYSLDVNPISFSYFNAHIDVERDIKEKSLKIYTEDFEFYLLDSIYGWLNVYNTKAKYTPWDIGDRNKRFVYNCYAENYIFGDESSSGNKIAITLDSLLYIELDQYCDSEINLIEFPILKRLNKISFNLQEQAEVALNYNYHQRYIKQIDKDQLDSQIILDSLLFLSDYKSIKLVEVYSYKHPDAVIEKLASMITDTSYVGLTNSADLIIPDRLESGDLEFYGHGGIVLDDLFTISGRANHILSLITNSSLGQVRINSDLEYLEKLQCRWETYTRILQL